MSEVSVILDWRNPEAWEAVQAGDVATHLLTNSRAYDGSEAGRLVESAATSARRRLPAARIILRGDSTLRAHLWEEYDALRAAIAPTQGDVPLLLVPAFPAAGRVTIGGIHLLERHGNRTPLDRTEYSKDGALAYSSADLSRWAEERSGGRLSASDAIAIPLERLRGDGGANAVATAIAESAKLGRPAVVVPDAETDSDLQTIAKGLRLAEEQRLRVIVRCAPAFLVALTEAPAADPVKAPSGSRGVLIICGSFVSTSTAQIDCLSRAYPDVTVYASVTALAETQSDSEVEQLSKLARNRIERTGLAVVATERARNPGLVDAASQRRIASALAQVASRVDVGVVIAKGGITAAITALEGMHARTARVLGPIRPGVAHWQLPDGRDYVVVPGNVGGPALLAEVVDAIAPAIPRRTAVQRC